MAKKASGGGSQVQPELEGMPDRSKLGKAAIAYLQKKRDIETSQTEQDGLRDSLIKEFVAAGKTSIKVEGTLLFYSHVEKDSIKVKTAE